jgi:hypothetical protein
VEHIDAQNSHIGSRKKYLVLFVIFLLVVGGALGFSGSGKKLLKGNFGFCFDPTDSSCNEQVIDLSGEEFAGKDDGSRIPESEFSEPPAPWSPEARKRKKEKDEQRKMSDDTRAYYFNEDGDVVDMDGKNQWQKDAEKQEEEYKKQQEEAKNRIVVSLSSGFSKMQTLDPKKISPENPATAASFKLCTEGNIDGVIKGIQFETWGSSGEKYVQFYVENKPTSSITKITNSWSGDFLTVDNLLLPKGTCTNVSLKLTGVSDAAEWHYFRIKAISANLKTGYFEPSVGGGSYFLDYFNGSDSPWSYVVFKPELQLNIGSSNPKDKTLTYKIASNAALPTINPHFLGGFTLATKKNSTASVKSVKIRLKGNKGKNLSVKILKKLAFEPWWNTSWPVEASNDIPANLPSVAFEPEKDVTVVLDTEIPYSSALTLTILNDSIMKDPTEFHFELTDVETSTPAKWQSPAPLPAENIFYVEKIEPVKQMKIDTFLGDGYSPWSGQWWIDSASAKTSISKNGYAEIGRIAMGPFAMNISDTLYNPKIQIKNLKIKLGGTFNDPLSVRTSYIDDNNGQKKTVKMQVPKNGILEIPELTITNGKNLSLELLEYPLDPKFTFSIKPVIVSLEATYLDDNEYVKKGEYVPLVTWDKEGEKLIPFTLPHSFGIVTFGPTILVNTSSEIKPGINYVDIAKLPKGQTSEFEVHKSCFKAQGQQTINAFTFQHVVRDTSPFDNIKLVYGTTEVFLKPNDWTKELAVFTLTTPLVMSHAAFECFSLRVIDPKEAVEDFWFSLKEIESAIGQSESSQEKIAVPVYNGPDLLKDKPIKGSVYTFQ